MAMKGQEGIAAGTVCKDLGTVQFTVVRVQAVLNSSLSLRPGSFAEGDNEHALTSKSVGRIQKMESIRSALDAVAWPIPYNQAVFFSCVYGHDSLHNSDKGNKLIGQESWMRGLGI